MGLFDILKKKTPTHEEKVESAYKCYKPDMVSMVFPGGQTQANKIIRSLAKIYDVNLENSEAKKYYDILLTYSDVLIHKVITHSEDNQIVASLQVKHRDLITNKEVAQKALTYCKMNMTNNEYEFVADEDTDVLNLLSSMFSENEKIVMQNAEVENENRDDPEYGLVVEKPIFTHGVAGSKQYLASLQTVLGQKLEWKRLGSTSAKGINGIIDIYEGTLPVGKVYKKLYLNMYGTSNSAKVPKGFMR